MNYINHISNTVKQFAEVILPETLQIVTPWQDPRIGKILEGIGVCSTGISLVAFSGVVKTKVWTNIAPCNQESLSKKALRYGMFATGLAALCYSVYNFTFCLLEWGFGPNTIQNTLVNQLAENFCPKPNQTLLSCPNEHLSSYTTPLTNQIVAKSCQEHLEEAKQILLSCPEAKNLWETIEREKPFFISCTQPSETIFGAETNPFSREITVVVDKEVGYSLLFELHNLYQAKKINLLKNTMCSFTSDQFALDIEKIEYWTSEATKNITKACQKFWSKDFAFSPGIPVNSLSFDRYCASQELGGHTDLIRIKWYQICDPKQVLFQCSKMYLKYLEIINNLQIALAKEASIEMKNHLKIALNQVETFISFLDKTINSFIPGYLLKI